MVSVCAQEDVPEALRKKAEPASTQGSALPSRAVSQDASLATGAATAAAAATEAQPEVASAISPVKPDASAAALTEGDAAAPAVAEALPAPQPASEAGQAAEPMQIDAPAEVVGTEQISAAAGAAAESTATEAAADQPQAGVPAAEETLDTENKAAQAADITAPPKGGLSLDKQLLCTRSRSDPLDSSKGAPAVSKEAPSVSAPNGNGTSLHEGDALQEAEQPNGKALAEPEVQEAAQPEVKPSKPATDGVASLENGMADMGEAAAPAKQSRPAVKRTRRS